VDLIEGAPELVACGAAPEQLRRTLAADTELSEVARASARTAGVGQGLTSLCMGLAMWGALLVGVAAVRAGRLDGALLAAVALIPLVAFELVAGLPGATQTLQRVRRAAARVQAVIDTPAPVVEPEHPQALPAANNHPPNGWSHNGRGYTRRRTPIDSHEQQIHTLRARNLSCTYPGAEHPALHEIDLDLSPGRRVAIVGPSGAGKSTLAGVLLRFLPYQSGSVTLDGAEIDRLDGDELRRVVGLVGQDAHVFDSTLEENLRLARREATADDLRDVLARARLLGWVDSLPDGLATELGERGARMSGGQRQRLAIARALLADFPILILDEPGEHLDTVTADAIVSEALAATRDKATLLVTHRLARLGEVDEILLLARAHPTMGGPRTEHGGRVLERGTHDDLIGARGRYADWFHRESGNGPGG
jgi:thiol reductant ABC exporter CydC subunit